MTNLSLAQESEFEAVHWGDVWETKRQAQKAWTTWRRATSLDR